MLTVAMVQSTVKVVHSTRIITVLTTNRITERALITD